MISLVNLPYIQHRHTGPGDSAIPGHHFRALEDVAARVWEMSNDHSNLVCPSYVCGIYIYMVYTWVMYAYLCYKPLAKWNLTL